MNAAAVHDLRLCIQHILDTVPFAAGTTPKGYFLGVYKLTHADLLLLRLSEHAWQAHGQVPVNRLLKLSISFGNLLNTFLLDRAQHEARAAAQQRQLAAQAPAKNGGLGDPFHAGYTGEPAPAVAPHHTSFARGFLGILKNFDIAPARAAFAEDGVAVPGAKTGSPIRLNSRQLLVEKLEINVELDALFTLKITLQLLQRLLLLLEQLAADMPPQGAVAQAPPGPPSDTSSIFSSVSGSSSAGDSALGMEEYARVVAEVVRRVAAGIVDPFVALLRDSVVKPRVFGGFQDLVDTI
ncbi:hypothetical protein METBIDRAFT_12622 [Metschnikowia bicuspidata var. bicuspidata NRRL YB-4993]|uniref:Uncharacterized protein n=1 Tax=Metschnikowia bicuspidata var. bicuspidata NRRL YB-4993 TaxID=869754 RepID=A0A1A0H9V2_9ASCO|nr:hypothetical protein METBIDRAFT_12622 [Metschnikowia bicuspidata var. bicuspidata NRRL YB-4993]OBA20653.1 hypothetical protein METBIDRAFT_12622 [Metschnikowia bicuspidata var. bicuspidata NRRL YB-4993]